MKKVAYILFVLGLAATVSCSNSESKSENQEITDTLPKIPVTTMEFESTSHDFGTIEQGESVTHIYTFKNTGTNDLVLSKVKASCGCTVPEWTKDPIKPQQDGKIEVVFNSKGRKGTQRKSVTVVANTDPQTTVLSFTAEVAEPKN